MAAPQEVFLLADGAAPLRLLVPDKWRSKPAREQKDLLWRRHRAASRGLITGRCTFNEEEPREGATYSRTSVMAVASWSTFFVLMPAMEMRPDSSM